jgi:hypothetical protein
VHRRDDEDEALRDPRRAGPLRAGLPLCLAAGLGLAAPAAAITVNDAAGLAAAEAAGAPFAAVARLVFDDGVSSGVCTGSLIAAGTVLTADHCLSGWAPGDVTVEFLAPGGAPEATRAVAAVSVLGDPFDGSNLLDGGDLALLTLAAPVTDRDPFALFADDPLGRVGRFVGYGGSGLGSTGAGPLDAVRRAADNVIDSVGPAPIPYRPGTPGIGLITPQAFPGSADILAADFDAAADDATGDASNTLFHVGSDGAMLPLEGSGAPGDSGGPLLIRTGLAWSIAGVLAGGAGAEGPPLSAYSDVSYWTGVRGAEAAAFLSGVEGVTWRSAAAPLPAAAAVPLPASAALLLAGGAALAGLARRHRRRA